MNKPPEAGLRINPRRILIIGGVTVAAVLIGGFVARSILPASVPGAQSRRPIVQIVRPQAGLPSIADVIAGLCPSIASIRPGAIGAAVQAGSAGTPAFVISSDGWLVTSASLNSAPRMHAAFGNGTEADISDVRIDPISGLAVAKASTTGLSPIVLQDQGFPRVGDFGFGLQSPNGNGCAAQTAMIASDFLADGGGPVSYVRTEAQVSPIPAGTPFFDSNGQAVAVSMADPDVPGAMIPAAIVGIIVDELIRRSPSPSIDFGFRVTDFSPEIADRVSNARLRGAGVAIVEPGSDADKAGLRAGDVVVAVSAMPISSASELSRALDGVPTKATLTVMRGGQKLTMAVPRAIPEKS